MRKSWMIRKDQEGVSPVIATILMVAITVVLAAVLYAMVVVLIPPEPPGNNMIGLSRRDTGSNWTLSVTSVPSSIPLGKAVLTMKDGNGAVKYPVAAIPFAELTADKWSSYKVLYQKLKLSDGYVTPGASLLLEKAAYPSGCSYEVSDGRSIIASGTL